MEPAHVTAELPKHFKNIISMDQFQQRLAIEKIYDPDCHFVNPYLVLHGRDEIISSYAALIKSNCEIGSQIDSVCKLFLTALIYRG
jgi:hypothetical protein